jgi:hypothetical protein
VLFAGCLREAERAGRGGGGMVVFLGEEGLGVGCVGVRAVGCLRGEGGAVESGGFVELDALPLLEVEMGVTLDVPGRIRLWRRASTDAVAVVAGAFFVSFTFCCLFGEVSRTGLFSGGWSDGCPVLWLSWLSSRPVLLRCGRSVRPREDAIPSIGEWVG